jgi:predicted alpha-1,2-mannosidase
MQHRDNLVHYSIYPLDDSTLVGHRVSDNWAREQHVYFAARFDRSFEWRDQLTEVRNVGYSANGDLLQEVEYVPVFAADFGVVSELNAEVALSFVSIDGALENLKAEATCASFEEYRQAAAEAWDEQLKRIDVEGGSATDQTIFYTALYHCLTAPNLANDVNGKYRGTDLQVHQLNADEGNHYTVFSLWDTFRALHPLLNWIEPERSRDFVRTMLRMYEQGGQLPVWELAANYTGCMIGYHSVPVIADAATWSINGFDANLALAAMQQAADSAHLGLEPYIELGYIPLDQEHESVSKTLEYAFDDACIASFAERSNVGTTESVRERFRLRALNYRNLFNPESGYFQPKRSAAWLEDFDPKEVNFNYTEANGWQYNFFVPHDVNGHIALLGGPEAYATKLDSMFTADSRTTGRNQADITGLIGQYAHGNEPSHHMAYLYPFVGKHHRTAELVDEIRSTLYSEFPDGLSGNEDCGQMSAWYVWSALGMYPVTPGSDQLIVGTPLFDRATVTPAHLEGRKQAPLTIERKGAGAYVSSVDWSGSQTSQHTSPGVNKDLLLEGGRLVFTCAETPAEFGTLNSTWPEEIWDTNGFVPVPVINAPRTFKQACEISLTTQRPGQDQVEFAVTPIYEEALNAANWTVYSEPIAATESMTIHARSRNKDNTSSVVSHHLKQVNHPFELQLQTAFSSQYAAGGDQALVDGIEGGNQFQTGDWQGFWGEDVHGQIDLSEVTQVNGVRIGALRDIRPWIFLPQRIDIEWSLDGAQWKPLGSATHGVDQTNEAPLKHNFIIRNNVEARYMRFKVMNHGLLPEGHLGAGNPSWVFLDEISIDCPEP